MKAQIITKLKSGEIIKGDPEKLDKHSFMVVKDSISIINKALKSRNHGIKEFKMTVNGKLYPVDINQVESIRIENILSIVKGEKK